MCVNSCMGFTGPLSTRDTCLYCNELRYRPAQEGSDKQCGRQQFTTIVPGPQIQNLFRGEETAEDMAYLYKSAHAILDNTPTGGFPDEYTDISSGAHLLKAFKNGTIQQFDAVLSFSTDGAQLMRNKKSDAWFYQWTVDNLPPDKRFKARFILPGSIIPGPEHPKNLDSFFFPGFYHVSALMNEGLRIWHAGTRQLEICHPFIPGAQADGPAMAHCSGTVPHHGALGCRTFCGMPGRHKEGGSHYYPVLHLPHNYSVQGSNHPDISLSSIPDSSPDRYDTLLKLLVASENEAQYQRLRKATGIVKPSMFSGFSRAIPVPLGFPLDWMHLSGPNLFELLTGLWRGTLKGSRADLKAQEFAVLQDSEVFVKHGIEVERAMAFLPGFFDRAPRNIAEKINSGYKSIEQHTYIFCYTPHMMRNRLPHPHWLHLCKLVKAGRIINSYRIPRAALEHARDLVELATPEYEDLYVKRNADFLHLVRPVVHLYWHCPDQIVWHGSLVCRSQYTMERTIGDLGSRIKQPSNPYANLSQIAARRWQENGMKALMPQFDRSRPLDYKPRGCVNLGDKFVLMWALEQKSQGCTPAEASAFYDYFLATHPDLVAGQFRGTFTYKFRRWARLRLPSYQIARCAWKEQEKPLKHLRMARCVKV